MKDFNRLDEIFDDALSRSETGNLTQSLSSMGPLASDHFLLKKSWVFFKKKMEQAEANFKGLMARKDQELKAISEAYEDLRKRLETYEEKRFDEEDLEENIIRQKLEEFEAFRSDHAKMVRANQEQLVQMEHAFRRMEDQYHREKDRAAELARALEELRTAHRAVLDRMNLDKEALLRNRIENEKKLREEISLLHDEMTSRDAKVDLLKKEIQVRNVELKKTDDENRALRLQAHEEEEKASSRQAAMEDMSSRYQEKEKEVLALKEELAAVREGWQREQSQWRELWDRARELWDLRKQTPPPAPSDE